MFQILHSVDPKLLRLTPHDNHIYKAFKDKMFLDMVVDKIDKDKLKSPEGKTKRRPFCE